MKWSVQNFWLFGRSWFLGSYTTFVAMERSSPVPRRYNLMTNFRRFCDTGPVSDLYAVSM